MNERAIFNDAIKISDPKLRLTFLDRVCHGNPKLRSEVEALLAFHTRAVNVESPPLSEGFRVSEREPANTYEFSSKSLGNEDLENQPTTPDTDADSSDHPIDLGFLAKSTKADSIGTLGHYEIQGVLGQGGFGIVLKAFDDKLHRLVAIKVMNPLLAATSPPRKRFLREARAAARIKHENIVQVHSVEENPLPYLVMEYVDGGTLQSKQDACGPLEVAELIPIACQIADGLAAAHAVGLIHRDIKPGNILLENSAKPKVKITDFGLARSADDASMTSTGVISGTPMYMAPEQAMGQMLDHRSDLFSMGSVMYLLACGRPPFRASTAIGVLKRVAEDAPRPLQEILPDLPIWLVSIIDRLHAKSPEHRFQSASELASLLRRCEFELQQTGKVTCVPETVSQDQSNRLGPVTDVEPPTIDIGKLPEFLGKSKYPRFVFAIGGIAIIVLGCLPLILSRSSNFFPKVDQASEPAGSNEKMQLLAREYSERETAEWIIQKGGYGLLENGTSFSHVSDLPATAFQIRNLTIRSEPGFSLDDSMRLRQLKRLAHVGFIDTTIAPGAIEVLSDLQHLRELNVTGGLTSESTFTEALRLPTLRSIELNRVSVNDDFCSNLGRLHHLQFIQFYDCKNIGEKGIVCMSDSPPRKLEAVVLAAMTVSDEAIKAVAQLPHLQTLSLVRSEITGTGISELRSCESLSSLTLSETSVSKSDVAELQNALNGCQIIVSSPDLAPPIQSTEYVNNIRALMARGFAVMVATNRSNGNQWVSGDAAFPSGEIVYLNMIDGGNEPFAINTSIDDLNLIAQLKDLSAINLRTLPADGLRQLLPLKNLTGLIIGSVLTQGDLDQLPSFSKLRELTIVIPNEATLDIIARLPHLRLLHLNASSKITGRGLKILESIKSLCNLSLANTIVSLEDVQAFADARPDVVVLGPESKVIEPRETMRNKR